MRIRGARLLAVVDPERLSERRRPGTPASPACSARSRLPSGSGRLLDRPVGSARTGVQLVSAAGSEGEERTLFDLLHTDRGFAAFDAFFKRLLATSRAAQAAPTPKPELGVMWPMLYCPPSCMPEHAFLELMHAFAECTDSDALDLFDLLDHGYRGFLTEKQIYFGIRMLAAMESKQLTPFLYFHAPYLFNMLAKRSADVSSERVSWTELLQLFRVLGVPLQVTRECGRDFGYPDGELAFEEFVLTTFDAVSQVERGIEIGERTTIEEKDRLDHVKSKMCSIL